MAMDHIGSVSGTGSSAIMTLTGIPDTYETLLLKGAGYTSDNAGPVEAYIRFNSDTGSVYDNLQGGTKDGSTYTANAANTSQHCGSNRNEHRWLSCGG